MNGTMEPGVETRMRTGRRRRQRYSITLSDNARGKLDLMSASREMSMSAFIEYMIFEEYENRFLRGDGAPKPE